MSLKSEKKEEILNSHISNPVWLSVSESAKIGGVTNKTIRRAIQSNNIKYKILKNRYLIDIASLIQYLLKTKKLENKLNKYGIGQYVDKWEK